MNKSQELREQRCKLIADARVVMDSAETLDAEQRSQVDAMLNDADTLKQDIDRMEAIEAEERQLTASAGKVADIAVSKAEERKEDKGLAQEVCDTILSLPIHPYMTEEEVNKVVNTILILA